MNNQFTVEISYNEQDKEFIAIVPDLPGCSACGKSRVDAAKNIDDAIVAYLNPVQEDISKYTNSKIIKGVLYVHSEQGVEAFWAMQDIDYIKFVDGNAQFSYDGIHMIENGDYLKVFDKNNKIVWEGIIVFIKSGYINKPNGISYTKWTKWFQNEYTGELTKFT